MGGHLNSEVSRFSRPASASVIGSSQERHNLPRRCLPCARTTPGSIRFPMMPREQLRAVLLPILRRAGHFHPRAPWIICIEDHMRCWGFRRILDRFGHRPSDKQNPVPQRYWRRRRRNDGRKRLAVLAGRYRASMETDTYSRLFFLRAWAHNPKVAGSNPAPATTKHSIKPSIALF